MCLGIPAEIIKLESRKKAIANIGGIKREISIQFLDGIGVGDFVLLHAGFAIQKIDQKEAKETLDFLRELSNTKD